MKKLLIVTLIASLLWVLHQAFMQSDVTVKVIRVSDGDTYVCRKSNGSIIRVRAASIDAPEKDQPHGLQAKYFAESLVLNKSVILIQTGTDKYGRTLGELRLPDNTTLSLHLAKAGLCWAWESPNTPKEIVGAVNESKAARRGLWTDAEPIKPYLWRKGERK